jgi:surface protein
MSQMFSGASSFGSDLSLWDVSSVTNMVSMFEGACLMTSVRMAAAMDNAVTKYDACLGCLNCPRGGGECLRDFKRSDSIRCNVCGAGMRMEATGSGSNQIEECVSCTAGSYSSGNTRSSSCKKCDVGTYSAEAGAAFCDRASPGFRPTAARDGEDACNTGTASIGGADECSLCDGPGEYADETGLSACKIAPAGFKPTSDHTGKEACQAGEYSIGGKSSCTSCPSGKYSEYNVTSGAVGCKACDLGSISPQGSSSCSPCPPPTYSDDGLACKQCDGEGQYSDVNGASFCKTSPSGTKPTTDHTDIETCPQNTFSIGANNTCAPCKHGTFSKPGASSCLPCPQYETPNNSTQTCDCIDSFLRIGADNTCSCKTGETLMGTSCRPCERGKWKGKIGVESCKRCESTLKGSITIHPGSTSKVACICPKETYDGGASECLPTEEGMRTDQAGMSLKSLQLEPGYWRTGTNSSDIRECPNDGACIGGTIGSNTSMCREGHAGPYCDLCLDGFVKNPLMVVSF